MSKTGNDSLDALVDEAARFVREHASEHQSWELSTLHPVCMTVIYQKWALAHDRPVLDVMEAPMALMKVIEDSRHGHEVFDRTRDGSIIAYGLRRDRR